MSDLLTDIQKIPPNLSHIDGQTAVADALVRDWMRNPDNKASLDAKKSKYLHDKGFSVKRTFKNDCDIPGEAFFALPKEIRDNPKELRKWVETRHPYLLFKN